MAAPRDEVWGAEHAAADEGGGEEGEGADVGEGGGTRHRIMIIGTAFVDAAPPEFTFSPILV